MGRNFYDSDKYFALLDKYLRATNYLSVAQLYLLKNPLLRQPLSPSQIKKKIVGHWGTVPGQNFIYAHMDRVICKYDLDMIYISGPGHGGNFFIANSYLEGRYSEVYPEISEDERGMTKLCKQFSFPCGVSSHVAPEIPGSMHEGGELGYSLLHGMGAVLDNPNLIATVVVGDGEAETGPLATSWHLNKFLNPKNDGAVLPILHLNGYKISGATVMSRMPKKELEYLMKGYGWQPIFVEGDNVKKAHRVMAKAMDRCIERIKKIQEDARKGDRKRQPWPMIILRTPKGWTAPKIVDGKKMEGSFRSHQVPIDMSKPEHFELLKKWLLSYKADELFDENYRLKHEIKDILPKGERRISANPVTNGGLLLKDLILPNIYDYEIKTEGHGVTKASDMLELGKYMRDVFLLNKDNKNYRLFCPDEGNSNRIGHVFEVESRNFQDEIYPTDEKLSPDGRVMDAFLSEHACEGWLEGYILTGRHGAFITYEAFARVVDSMISQHAKWLKITRKLPWRGEISSLNLVLTSNIWQQDHNGYTHQEPGLLDHLSNKKSEIVRIYLPPDGNCLISCYDHCQASKNYINVIVASKHPSFQWLSMDEAVEHCRKGLSVWEWASSCKEDETPDLVLACAGDTPTLEALACVSIVRKYMPDVKIRFVNIVDIMRLQSNSAHPHGMTESAFDKIFTKNKPIIFNFHGYQKFVHGLLMSRKNKNIEIHGYEEEGTITTAFDIRVQNKIDRYHLVKSIIAKLGLEDKYAHVVKEMDALLDKHIKYIARYGVDMPEVVNWTWKD